MQLYRNNAEECSLILSNQDLKYLQLASSLYIMGMIGKAHDFQLELKRTIDSFLNEKIELPYE